MSNLFDSIFNNATATVDPFALTAGPLISLFLGLALSWTYKYRTLYTREFVISLTLLPSMMTLVIFLVNGSLGTSIAVAGTFSLIRFRSATSGSRELIAIFLAMIIGLAAGSGYLLLAILSTLSLLGVWLVLENKQSKADHQAPSFDHYRLKTRFCCRTNQPVVGPKLFRDWLYFCHNGPSWRTTDLELRGKYEIEHRWFCPCQSID